MPLTNEIRKDSHKKMEEHITSAQRVKRRLKSGPHVRKMPDALSILEAVHRLSVEADRSQNAMREEQLEPKDAHLGLLFSIATPSADGLQESIGARWLGAPGRVSDFIAGLEQLAAHSKLTFLGIVWAVLDREANKVDMWAKPLVAGQQEKLELARKLFESPHRIN